VWRGVCLVAVGFMVLAGCGGGESDRAAPGAGQRAEPQAKEVVRSGRPSKAEVRWAGRVVDFWYGLSGPLETVVRARESIAEGGSPAPDVLEALDQIVGCSDRLADRVPEPPSERLETVVDTLERACSSFAEGAKAARQLARGVTEGDLVDDWDDQWTQAGEALASVQSQLVDFQPGNDRRLPVRGGMTGVSRVEPRFAKAAEAIAEHDVEVRCWSAADYRGLVAEMKAFTNGRIGVDTLGWVGFGDYRVNLAPDVCEGLALLAYEGARPEAGDDLVLVSMAVETLAHEAQHVRGVANEAAAECYGMQRLRDVATALGAEPAYAELLTRVYWERIYPELLSAAYHSRECRDGGGMDARPESARFP